MEVSRERMTLVKQMAGRESKRGWLTINLRGLDLENVNEIRLNLDLLDEMGSRQEQASRLFESLARKLPGEGGGEKK